MSQRAAALADRITQGANTLADLVETLDDAQWQIPVPGDGRSVGVIAHHVASAYPIEVQLAQILASGNAIEDVTWDAVDAMNAEHAGEHSQPGRAATAELLRQNSSHAAKEVAAMTDEQLDSAATVSLNAGAPLTAQFFIEDHALRHSFHHMAKIRTALGM